MRLRLQGHYFPKIGLFSVQDNYFAISPHKIVMWKCFRLSALRRSLGATPWWWPRRWPRSNRQHLVGFSLTNKSMVCYYYCFQPSPCLQWMGREHLTSWVFRDTELEIFPWQGTFKVSPVFSRPLYHGGGCRSVHKIETPPIIVGGQRRGHELLRYNIVALQRFCLAVRNFNSEQRNCLVIISWSGLDLNLVRLKSKPDCLI